MEILTIGHSNHEPEQFSELLRKHGVEAIADVRSRPYSRYAPAYNQAPLAEMLKSESIEYVFLGRELGARSEDPSCYEDGQVQYRRLAATELFRAGIERVLNGAGSRRIALVCAEREPLDCHRAILVARELVEVGADVSHVHADGHLESHDELLHRLLDQLGWPEQDLLRTRAEVISDAYAAQEDRIAYVNPVSRGEGETAR